MAIFSNLKVQVDNIVKKLSVGLKKEIIISEAYILKRAKAFKLKKDNFIFWDRRERGYKNIAIVLDKDIYLYFLGGTGKVKIEFPSETEIEGLVQYRKYTINGSDRKGFYLKDKLKSSLVEIFNKLIDEVDTHYVDKDIKKFQPKYKGLSF